MTQPTITHLSISQSGTGTVVHLYMFETLFVADNKQNEGD